MSITLKNQINKSKKTRKNNKNNKIKEQIIQSDSYEIATSNFYPKLNNCDVSDYKSFEKEFGEKNKYSSSKNYENELIKVLNTAYSQQLM